MAITLSPELEEIVVKDAHALGFESAEAYVRTVLLESHMGHNLDEIRAAIDEGWEQAQRGQLIDAETVWARLEEHKVRWRTEQAG
jgi:hypothetical protein